MQFKSVIQGYSLKVKRKGKRKLESSDSIFSFLRDINNCSYDDANPKKNRRQPPTGGFKFAMDFFGFPENLNEELTKVNFMFGRETKESFPTKDVHGHLSSLNLRPEENLCFNTHGSFLFRKFEGQWECIILLERRFHTAGLSKILDYIKKFQGDYTISSNPLVNSSDYIRKILAINGLKAVILKNSQLYLNPSDRSGTIFVKNARIKKNEVTKIEVELIKEGDNLARFKDFVRRFLRLNQEPTNEELIQFIDENEVLLVKKIFKNSEEDKRYINLLKDLFLTSISVEQNGITREINSKDFFKKLYDKIGVAKINELFKLSRKADDYE